ncbi:DUF2935 domain-containing protein [Brevibacillus composti]|uniref:DUF2935 domain-containing protein n=1 Tax=Brevibacillus composti TaxID=2796470 RepID=A0A7T5EN93_9BACL|nr:DUF2935 domain-containing protein [Brevibacillus composti]QQE75753.1 DUF2935 domain-containing protein [Brevibacillus composti]QUO42779.1 DUF2935 domain-containing protein [Brevibacillus composti]
MREDAHHPILFEHRFWLQILGDHARFIHQSLAPKESREIELANDFIQSFDRLLAESRRNLSGEESRCLTEQANQRWNSRDICAPMADHMSREECYYLMKLSEVTDVNVPDCYPTRPRVE